jgi:hypothetical protein
MRLLHLVMGLALATTAFADVITLKNGRVINGTYLGGSPRQVKVEVADQIMTLEVSDIARIEFSGIGNASSAPANDGNQPTLRRAQPRSYSQSYPSDSGQPTLRRAETPSSSSTSSASASPGSDDPDRPTLKRNTTILHPDDDNSVSSPSNGPAPPRAPVELPAGTSISVRMIDAVDSSQATVGQTFHASISDALTYNGMTLVPRGADAVVKLVDAHDSGKLTGKADVTLSLWSVKVDGKMVDVNTQTISKQSDAKSSKTATMAGGGAVAGAIIGAIAGGGKGAAIGAGSGAAAGTGVSAVTKGPAVKVPSETVLTFSLENAVTI